MPDGELKYFIINNFLEHSDALEFTKQYDEFFKLFGSGVSQEGHRVFEYNQTGSDGVYLKTHPSSIFSYDILYKLLESVHNIVADRLNLTEIELDYLAICVDYLSFDFEDRHEGYSFYYYLSLYTAGPGILPSAALVDGVKHDFRFNSLLVVDQSRVKLLIDIPSGMMNPFKSAIFICGRIK
jgi:hypothetical protein